MVGRRIRCEQVRHIIQGSCRDGRVWSCFSFHPPAPVLVWFREEERFQEHWSTTIEARRYPCEQATVTREAWTKARRDLGSEFPRRLQVLADDLVRCGQLKGMSYRAALRLLGPGGRSSENGKRYLRYILGDERDSFFQVDDEFLTIEFGRDGIFDSAHFVQG